mmetsp:Transcript_30131/g.35828  ORF Transcript_30131/g.35828 Transcript_30131/m.35828 type:complete len:159 (-) Transcript_30131:275-751(-)
MNIKAYPGIPSIMKIVIGTHLVHSYATEHDHVSDNITSKANESSSKTSNSTTVTQDHTSEQNSKCTAVIMSHTQNPYTTPINKDYANDTYAKLKPSDKDIPTGDLTGGAFFWTRTNFQRRKEIRIPKNEVIYPRGCLDHTHRQHRRLPMLPGSLCMIG